MLLCFALSFYLSSLISPIPLSSYLFSPSLLFFSLLYSSLPLSSLHMLVDLRWALFNRFEKYPLKLRNIMRPSKQISSSTLMALRSFLSSSSPSISFSTSSLSTSYFYSTFFCIAFYRVFFLHVVRHHSSQHITSHHTVTSQFTPHHHHITSHHISHHNTTHHISVTRQGGNWRADSGDRSPYYRWSQIRSPKGHCCLVRTWGNPVRSAWSLCHCSHVCIAI